MKIAKLRGMSIKDVVDSSRIPFLGPIEADPFSIKAANESKAKLPDLAFTQIRGTSQSESSAGSESNHLFQLRPKSREASTSLKKRKSKSVRSMWDTTINQQHLTKPETIITLSNGFAGNVEVNPFRYDR